MDRQLFLASKKIMLTVVLLLAISYVQAQETKEPLTLTLDKALEIALSDNPTIKVAEEEIALKKVANKETWQSLLPEASIGGTWNHTITAAQMNLGGQSFKMGQDDSNTVSGTLNISLPLFAPSVYKAMSMTKTDIELAVEKSRASKQDLVNQVTKAYYQLMLHKTLMRFCRRVINWQKTIITWSMQNTSREPSANLIRLVLKYKCVV